jgi:hypothetical protein
MAKYTVKPFMLFNFLFILLNVAMLVALSLLYLEITGEDPSNSRVNSTKYARGYLCFCYAPPPPPLY